MRLSRVGWRSRDYLPHFDGGEITQFITFRLHDSLPQSVLGRWRRELERETGNEALLRQRIEAYLDAGYGNSFLKDARVAQVVQEALLFHDGSKYRLLAWVIMPNHVHLLLTPQTPHSLSEIMHALKSFTASAANRLLRRTGPFWQKEYFDRFVRDQNHFIKTRIYIEQNPVEAKLCAQPQEWLYGSAHSRSEQVCPGASHSNS